MTPPFIIYALPRSRTFWLSRFLSGDGALKPCGHDIGISVDSLHDAKTVLTETLAGTVETGSMMAWRWLRRNIPEARFVVIRRPIDEVATSLERCGLNVPRSVLELRASWLDEISAQYGTITLDADRLDDPNVCSFLFRMCRGVECSALWLALNIGANIQLKIEQRVAMIRSRHIQIEALKAEAELSDRKLRGEFLPFVEYRSEPWSRQIENEGLELAERHFEEVDDGVEPRRPFRLDIGVMRNIEAAGMLQLNTARVDGVLSAYCMWTISPDPESAGLTIANQGPWFATDAPELRRLRLGTTVFDRSIVDLKNRGVQCVFPHHRTQGRSPKVASFLLRRGAKEIQRGYSLWIGD